MISVPATNTDAGAAAWLCGLLQAGDSFYPTGSYAHSFGLEGMIHAGVVHDRATLRQFIFLSVLPMLRQAELPIVAQGWQALAARDWKRVGNLCQLAAALKAPREARAASSGIGRQRAELAARLHGGMARDYLEWAQKENWPLAASVSAAVEAHVLGAPQVAAMAGYTYAALAGSLAAAMKLLRLGQNGAQSLLTEALAETPNLISHAAEVPFQEIGWFNPWLDIAAARHESADARMFIS